jgi:hypothetical protein
MRSKVRSVSEALSSGTNAHALPGFIGLDYYSNVYQAINTIFLILAVY